MMKLAVCAYLKNYIDMIKRIVFVAIWIPYFPIALSGFLIGMLVFPIASLLGFIIKNDDEYYEWLSDSIVDFFAFIPNKIVGLRS